MLLMKNAVWHTPTVFKENQNKTFFLKKGMAIICISVFKNIYSWLLSVSLRENIPKSHNWEDLKEGSLSFPPLIYRLKKSLRLREIKLNRFIKVTEKESQIFPLPASEGFTLAWPSVTNAVFLEWQMQFWPQDPGAQETLSVGSCVGPFPPHACASLKSLSAGTRWLVVQTVRLAWGIEIASFSPF